MGWKVELRFAFSFDGKDLFDSRSQGVAATLAQCLKAIRVDRARGVFCHDREDGIERQSIAVRSFRGQRVEDIRHYNYPDQLTLYFKRRHAPQNFIGEVEMAASQPCTDYRRLVGKALDNFT